MDKPKPIRVEFRIRNNLLLQKMEDWGIKSVKEFAELIGAPEKYSQILALISMRTPARLKNDEWRPLVLMMCNYLRCLPEDIFSSEQERGALQKNTAIAKMTFSEVQQLTSASAHRHPDLLIQAEETKRKLIKALSKLTPREERVIRMRFGLENGNEMTLEEVGKSLGVSRDRIRMIQNKAIKKLRHASRSGEIIKSCGTTSQCLNNEGVLCRVVRLDSDVLEAL